MTPSVVRALALLCLALVAPLSAASPPAAAQGVAPAGQRITIETPAPGTQVGSPMTVTGSTAQLPAGAILGYTVFASDGRVIGSGSFPVPGNPGQPAYFIASIPFAEPLEGDAISLQLVDQDPAAGAVATLPLTVAPVPQRILVETPAANTMVGNPVVVTGRTTRFPPSGHLGYAIYNSAGAWVGGSVFPVEGSPQTGGRFVASLSFAYPDLGGPLRIDLYDQDPFTGAFLATASLQVRTAALRQQITIETPPSGTQVGSPVVITGRTARYPIAGVLQYRISDGRGALLGAGSFPVAGSPGDQARFAASIGFQPPAANGPLRAEIFELDPQGFSTASAWVELRWGP